mgnify:CR=1 FL=1
MTNDTGYRGETRYRQKKHHSTAFVVTTTFLVAVFLVIVTFVAIYMSGIRYLKNGFDDGSYVKFFGKVDKEGFPVSGKLYYSDGKTATIDLKTSTVTYSNGSVYEGTLINLQRNGKGKMTNANKDVYVGDFVNDRQTGHGTITYYNGDVYEGDFFAGVKDGEG